MSRIPMFISEEYLPDDYLAHPHMRKLTERLQTYGVWSHPLHWSPTPSTLALEGFFCTGPERDRTVCYGCGIELVRWQEDDIPAVEHRSHSQSHANRSNPSSQIYSKCPLIAIRDGLPLWKPTKTTSTSTSTSSSKRYRVDSMSPSSPPAKSSTSTSFSGLKDVDELTLTNTNLKRQKGEKFALNNEIMKVSMTNTTAATAAAAIAVDSSINEKDIRDNLLQVLKGKKETSFQTFRAQQLKEKSEKMMNSFPFSVTSNPDPNLAEELTEDKKKEYEKFKLRILWMREMLQSTLVPQNKFIG